MNKTEWNPHPFHKIHQPAGYSQPYDLSKERYQRWYSESTEIVERVNPH